MRFFPNRFSFVLLFLFLIVGSAFAQNGKPERITDFHEHHSAEVCILHPTDVSTNYKYVPNPPSRMNMLQVYGKLTWTAPSPFGLKPTGYHWNQIHSEVQAPRRLYHGKMMEEGNIFQTHGILLHRQVPSAVQISWQSTMISTMIL